jgi:hypothetical protein
MKVQPPEPIKLTAKEKKLADAITFDVTPMSVSDEVARDSCEKAKILAQSIIGRKAVPVIRMKYFVDPELNNNYGKSRKQVFESNGTSGDEIFGHPHFLPHLRYFIYGPGLPASTISEFCNILNNETHTTGGQMKRLRAFARSEIRAHQLNKADAADAFFMLAHESDLNSGMAESIRDAAQSTR